MANPCPLNGLGVLVTRPAHQAEGLCQLIEAAGGRPLRFPALAIQPTERPDAARALFAQPWDWLLFISANAVEQTRDLLGQLPDGPRLAAVGQATADALAAAGRPADLMPDTRFDSEALLASPAMQQVKGLRILIVRGVGGRALLVETLRERGAQVALAEVYRRECPRVNAAPLIARWTQEVGAVLVTSGELLDNLIELLGAAGREPLLATPLVVVSPRMAEQARQLGFSKIGVAERAQDPALVDALCALREG